MDRLFLDANILFSAAYRTDSGLRKLWKLPGVVLLSSRYALEEARINLDQELQRRALDTLARKLQFAEAESKRLLSKIELPEKDVPILLGAIAAKATHLITGDLKHFGAYFGKMLEGVLILPPSEYFRRRE